MNGESYDVSDFGCSDYELSELCTEGSFIVGAEWLGENFYEDDRCYCLGNERCDILWNYPQYNCRECGKPAGGSGVVQGPYGPIIVDENLFPFDTKIVPCEHGGTFTITALPDMSLLVDDSCLICDTPGWNLGI
eukprot:UN23715